VTRYTGATRARRWLHTDKSLPLSSCAPMLRNLQAPHPNRTMAADVFPHLKSFAAWRWPSKTTARRVSIQFTSATRTLLLALVFYLRPLDYAWYSHLASARSASQAASLPRNVISPQGLEAVARDFIPPVGHLFFSSTQTSVKIKGKRKWHHCWQTKTRLMTLIRTYHSPFVVQLLYRDTSTGPDESDFPLMPMSMNVLWRSIVFQAP